MTEPDVRVGIITADSITLVFHGMYTLNGVPVRRNSPLVIDAAAVEDGTVYIPAVEADDCFEVYDVTIGVDFHWQRKENQKFRGAAEILVCPDGRVTLVNVVSAEEYFSSVISSEMNAGASEQFLKAHAVISRSWLFARIGGARLGDDKTASFQTCSRSEGRLVRWYDHTDHHRFDVCADDHCQRYQGIARQTTDTVRKAVRDTRGEVLVCQGKLVDARFSKCCGGVFEQFENCWEPVEHPYLQARRDAPCATDFPDLTDEKNARQWILSRPDAFCAAPSGEVLSQVLNGYDMETPDFYRWRVEYDRHTLASIVRERTGIDFGDIIDLQPLERGTSGRIVMLRIVGTRHTMEIGKELEIRRSLSDSHLYSSAFVVERADIDSDGVPARIILHGAGWGHGVGLCQIGAAVMGDSGYDYKTILGRYFIGAGVDKLY